MPMVKQLSIQLAEPGSQKPTFGYIVDLAKYTFQEDEDRWIQAFPFGTWNHPTYGELRMTYDRALRFAANVNAGVRGQDLDIDYDHKEKTTEAAGWIKKAEARDDGLYVLVGWTVDAYQKIKNKAFRYFSPEFQDEWEHPASGVKFQDVLFGGALTNRPFLKGIQAINLSEFTSTSLGDSATNKDDDNNSGGKMNPRELLEFMAGLYDVSFDEKTSDDDLKKAVSGKLSSIGSGDSEATAGEGNSGKNGTPPGEPSVSPQVTPAMATELKKLAGENSVVAALLAEREQDRKRIRALETNTRMTEIRRQLTETSTERFALAPHVHQKLSEVLVGLEKRLSDDIIESVGLILAEGGMVRLGELGYTVDTRQKDALTLFNKEVKKLMEADKNLTYSEASAHVAAVEPELYDGVRRASYIDVEI